MNELDYIGSDELVFNKDSYLRISSGGFSVRGVNFGIIYIIDF